MSAANSVEASPAQSSRTPRRKMAEEICEGEPPAKCVDRGPNVSRYVTVPPLRFKPRTLDEFAQFLENDSNRVVDMDIWSLFGEGNYVNYRVKLVITALLEKIDRLQRGGGGGGSIGAPVYEEVHYLDVDDMEPRIIMPPTHQGSIPNSAHNLHHRRPSDGGVNTSLFMFLDNPPMPREYYDIRPNVPDLRNFNLLDTYTLLKHRRGTGGFRLELKRFLTHMTRMIHSNAARGQYTMIKPGVRRDAKKKQYPSALIEQIVDGISSLIINLDGTEPDKVALSILIKDTWIAVLYEDRRNPPRFFPFSDEELEALSGEGRHYVNNGMIRRKIEPESQSFCEIAPHLQPALEQSGGKVTIMLGKNAESYVNKKTTAGSGLEIFASAEDADVTQWNGGM